MSSMGFTRFLFELSAATDDRSPLELVAFARSQAQRMRVAGTPVRVIRSLYVPEDDAWFLLVEGRSAAAVEELARACGGARDSIRASIPIGPEAAAVPKAHRPLGPARRD